MNRRIGFSLGALALIAATALVASQPSGERATALRGPLEVVPAAFPAWRPGEPPSKDVFPEDTVATDQLVRAYQNGALSIWVSVGYYPLQATTKRPPARDLLFPRSGWTELSEQRVTLPIGGGGAPPNVSANLVLMTTAGRRLAIIYWYQVGHRAVASDHWYRTLVLYNRLVHGRADGTLIRIASPIPSGMPVDAILGHYAEFLRMFLPELLRRLPE